MFMANDGFLSFPEGFLWGVASAAYQIEGAVNEDGRGPSIWDTFSHQPGKTRNGETGDVAADHYHRWQEDLRIMKDLGVKVYRFSIAWPRILPTGSGQVNKPGLDFYDRLVDTLLDAGIEPFPTLYHWDLPQALQDRGGWPARDTARYFADYAQVVGERLGDRVNYWITHNEPWVAAFAGYFQGEHAPGIQDPVAAFLATHHLLLGHGLACEALRAACRNRPRVGIVLNLTPMHPATDSQADREAAARADAGLNRLFLDPLFKREYPPELIEQFGPIFTPPQPGDMERIAAPLDWLGVNYYSRHVVRYDPDEPITHLSQVQPVGNEYSQMWEIYPPGIYEMLTRVWKDYRPPFMIVTENGICVPDVPDLDGRIRDVRRIAYLHDHIAQVHRAIQEGVPVRGYFVWSLTDNFEWAHGYGMRFGLTYVDYATQARTVKESGWWYKGVIEANGVKSET
jgi:beta-glucosidase